MVSFVGNGINPAGQGIFSSDKVLKRGYKDIIGNGIGLFGGPVARFTDATFTNTSHRMLSQGNDNPSVTLFEPGVLATRRIDGHLFGQIELDVTNINTQTQNFSHPDWDITQIASVAANAVVSPEGQTLGDCLVETVANQSHGIFQSFTPDGSSQYCLSVYAKKAARNWCHLHLEGGGFPTNGHCYFDLNNGVVGTPGADCDDEGIEDAGNGWYRCWIVVTSNAAASSDTMIHIANADGSEVYQGDGSNGIHVWQAQTELGTYPTSPIMSGENIAKYSQELENPVWDKTRASIDENLIASPELLEGNITADFLKEDDSSGVTHIITDSIVVDGLSNYCFSVYVKASSRNWIRMLIQPTRFVSSAYVYFDVENGAIGSTSGSPVNYGIEDVGDGWYRCFIANLSNLAGGNAFTIALADGNNGALYDGDSVSGLYLWGIQVETGTAPGPYVHTEASGITGATTRVQDQLWWEDADVPPALRRKVTFKWIPEYDHDVTPNDRYLGTWRESGASHRINVYFRHFDHKIRVHNFTTTTTLVDSSVLTFSRGQILTITIDPAEGSVEVSGATTGNGKVIGSVWSTSEGRVYWGQNANAGVQNNGLISEPYV